jgi:hypothetical protein
VAQVRGAVLVQVPAAAQALVRVPAGAQVRGAVRARVPAVAQVRAVAQARAVAQVPVVARVRVPALGPEREPALGREPALAPGRPVVVPEEERPVAQEPELGPAVVVVQRVRELPERGQGQAAGPQVRPAREPRARVRPARRVLRERREPATGPEDRLEAELARQGRHPVRRAQRPPRCWIKPGLTWRIATTRRH